MSPRTPHRIRDATSHRWRRKESVNKSYTTVEELEAEREAQPTGNAVWHGCGETGRPVEDSVCTSGSSLPRTGLAIVPVSVRESIDFPGEHAPGWGGTSDRVEPELSKIVQQSGESCSARRCDLGRHIIPSFLMFSTALGTEESL